MNDDETIVISKAKFIQLCCDLFNKVIDDERPGNTGVEAVKTQTPYEGCRLGSAGSEKGLLESNGNRSRKEHELDSLTRCVGRLSLLNHEFALPPKASQVIEEIITELVKFAVQDRTANTTKDQTDAH